MEISSLEYYSNDPDIQLLDIPGQGVQPNLVLQQSSWYQIPCSKDPELFCGVRGADDRLPIL